MAEVTVTEIKRAEVAEKGKGTVYTRTKTLVEAINAGKIHPVMNEIFRMSYAASSSKFNPKVDQERLTKARMTLLQEYGGKIVKNKNSNLYGLVVGSNYSQVGEDKGALHLDIIVLSNSKSVRETTWSPSSIEKTDRSTLEFMAIQFNLSF